RLANGSLKLINVPELKELETKSVIAYDRHKPLSSIAQEFLTLLRERAKRVRKINSRLTASAVLNARERELRKCQHVSGKTARKYSSPHASIV
ncbi:MAG: hypothetical protein ACTHMB_21840, partial [Candidatus Binatia bacterium]